MTSATNEQALALIGGMPSVESVRQLGNLLIDLPQIDLGTKNLVHGGMCARTIFIPAGTVLAGAVTNLPNICIVSGDITVTTDEGAVRLTGVNVLPANPGAKRAGVTHVDTWWTTIWRTELTNIQDIEDEMTDESEILQTRREGIVFAESKKLGGTL